MLTVRAIVLLCCCIWVSQVSAQSARLSPELSPSLVGAAPASWMLDPRANEPSSGLGPIIAGWAVSGFGVLNGAAIPVCFADFYPKKAKDICIGASIAVAGVGLAVGIPLLIIGYNQKAARNAWREKRGLAYNLSNLHLAALSGGGLAIYRGEW